MPEHLASPLLGALDLGPVAHHVARRLRRPLAEHVRMAADQLLAAVLGHRGEVTLAPLLEQQGQEVDLEQDVAQLIEQLGVVPAWAASASS